MNKEVLKQIEEDIGEGRLDFCRGGTSTKFFAGVPFLVDRFRFETSNGPVFVWVRDMEWGYC